MDERRQGDFDVSSTTATRVFQNETTREEIRRLQETNDEIELRARLGSRMAFGTAGNVV